MTSCPLRNVKKEGHGYFEEMNVPEKELYESKKNPGLSCLDINSCHDNDGEYWVSSELETSWNVTKAFCYMNSAKDANLINLARDKLASQSGTAHNGSAGRAVDGNKKHNFIQGSCTHTSEPGTNSPWWRVDLQSVVGIN
ncbi:Hypothetical predicted protein [Paramuricea clavata]|uniref:Uncharacterized protein n=1 Tax=Paramuricea clavata TaxID=317549 RepID=A0A6S7JF50_PARCT|nr:Hypothetical predicted protein [Paramuricea clavata]